MKQLGMRIRGLRVGAGMTQGELAKLLNVAPSTVGMYEQGRRSPDGAKLIKLCGIFSVSADSLLGMGNRSLEAVDVIHEMSKRFRSEETILVNGVPMTAEKKEMLMNAVDLAAGIMLSKISV